MYCVSARTGGRPGRSSPSLCRGAGTPLNVVVPRFTGWERAPTAGASVVQRVALQGLKGLLRQPSGHDLHDRLRTSLDCNDHFKVIEDSASDKNRCATTRGRSAGYSPCLRGAPFPWVSVLATSGTVRTEDERARPSAMRRACPRLSLRLLITANCCQVGQRSGSRTVACSVHAYWFPTRTGLRVV